MHPAPISQSPIPHVPWLCPCGSPADPDQLELHDRFPNLIPVPHCAPCAAAIDAQARQAEHLHHRQAEHRKRQAHLIDTLDPALIDTTITHPTFNAALYHRLLDWREDPRWIGIVGHPGLCKTRILALLVKQAILDHGDFVHWTTLPGLQTQTEILRIGTDTEKRQALKTIHRAKTCHLLILDDIGKNTWNPSLERHLFEILDHRANHYLRILWTANTHPLTILKSGELTPDRAGPIIGRIIQNSRIETAA
jgi:DNA replication protein DnaC